MLFQTFQKMRRCAVRNCNSNSNDPDCTNIRFHGLPAEKTTKMEWLDLLNFNEDHIAIEKSIFVCSQHFTVDDYMPTKQGIPRRLKSKILPTLKLPLKKEHYIIHTNDEKVKSSKKPDSDSRTNAENNKKADSETTRKHSKQIININDDKIDEHSSVKKETKLNGDNDFRFVFCDLCQVTVINIETERKKHIDGKRHCQRLQRKYNEQKYDRLQYNRRFPSSYPHRYEPDGPYFSPPSRPPRHYSFPYSHRYSNQSRFRYPYHNPY